MGSRLFLLKLFFPVAMIIANSANGQEKKDSSDRALYKEIAHLDSILFNAFNKRDVEQFKSLFTEDLEFYHDTGGLSNYDHTIDFLKGITIPGNDLRRDLKSGTLEVYPIPGYGAMEIGVHTFCHTEKDKKE